MGMGTCMSMSMGMSTSGAGAERRSRKPEEGGERCEERSGWQVRRTGVGGGEVDADGA